MPRFLSIFFVSSVTFVSASVGFYLQEKVGRDEEQLHDNYWKKQLIKQLEKESDNELKQLLLPKLQSSASLKPLPS